MAVSGSENVSPAAEDPARFPQPQKFQGTAIPPLSQKSPHRTPSLSPENPDFTNVLFIGDSRTAGLSEYGDLGQAEVFADSGMSVFNPVCSRYKNKKREQADIKGSFVSKAISNHLPDAGNQ